MLLHLTFVLALASSLGLHVEHSAIDHSQLGIYGTACDSSFAQYPGNVQAQVCEGRERSIVVWANGESHAAWIIADELGHYLYPDGLNEGSAWAFACAVAYDAAYCSIRPQWARD